MAHDVELERIEEEIRRHDERRKRLVERKNRRMRQIREKQLKDKERFLIKPWKSVWGSSTGMTMQRKTSVPDLGR